MIRFHTLLFFLFTLASASAQGVYTLSGTIDHADDIDIVYLYRPQQNGYITDSCYVKGGHFSFSGSVEYPVLTILELKNKKASSNNKSDEIHFYLENSPISITIHQSRQNTTISGSKSHDLHLEFIKLLEPIQAQMNSIRTAYRLASADQQSSVAFQNSLTRRRQNAQDMNSKCVYQFVNAHPTDFISLYLLQSQLDNTPDDLRIATAFSSLSNTIRESMLGKEFSNKLQQITVTAIGSTAPEFDCKDIDGNRVKLSQLRGKYVLLMFWASNCSHCIEEMPNVKKAFNLLQSENLAILSVAVDAADRQHEWEGYVKSNQLPWTNVFDERINGKKKISGLYNIHQTPSNFLLNKDGKIIAKNVYGDDLIQRLTAILQLSKISQ